MFPSDSEPTGKGPFREVQVIVDDKLAGVVWPHAVIYTGGITPSNWRPLTAYGAYDAPTYWIDITPFIPMLLEEGIDHSITLKVLGQGTDPSINSNWFVSGSVHVRKGKEGTRTTGQINTYSVPDTKLKTVGGTTGGNDTVWTKVEASRSLRIEGVLETGHVRTAVSFVQELRYVNEAVYVDEGWVQVSFETFSTAYYAFAESLHSGEIRLLLELLCHSTEASRFFGMLSHMTYQSFPTIHCIQHNLVSMHPSIHEGSL